MNDQIKARGWLWDKSKEHTQWLAWRCLECGNILIYPTNIIKKDCIHCEGKLIPHSYVRKVKEIKR